LELLRLYLEKEQYSVVIANDGNEALTRFAAENLPSFYW
jgi:CheY-like chemotaxis protein